MRLGEIDGPAVVKTSNGEGWIGAVTGDLQSGQSTARSPSAARPPGVDARTANGDIRIGEVSSGLVVLRTPPGEIEVGISAGTAAQLDLYTQYGRVHNELTAADGPGSGDRVVELQARTSYGDIVIRRAQPQ